MKRRTILQWKVQIYQLSHEIHARELQSSGKPTFENVVARSSISDKDPKTAPYKGGERQQLVAKTMN